MQAAFPQSSYRSGAAALLMLSALGWVFLVWSVANMDAPFVQLMMPGSASWSVPEIAVVWLMWAVMMGAMMLPSAMPMILVHCRLDAGRGGTGAASSDNRWFTGAYLIVWSVFSVAAAALQWALQAAGILMPMLVLTNQTVAGAVLIAAGIVQWTPLKQACLEKCRTPIGFLMTEWRDGRRGALIMGLKHGAYCVGCCWALMALLFVFGAMNLMAIGALATIVAAEKLLPYGDRLGKAGGVILMAWGVWMLVG